MRFFIAVLSLSLAAVVFAAPIAKPEAVAEPYVRASEFLTNDTRVAIPEPDANPKCTMTRTGCF